MSSAPSPKVRGFKLPTGDVSDRGLRSLMVAGLGALLFLCAIGTVIILGARFPLGTLIVCTIAAVLPVPIYASLILWLDRYEKEPTLLLVTAFLWGAVVATFFSILVNSGGHLILSSILGPKMGALLSAPLVAPIVEETSKGLALLLLFILVRNEFNGVIDGLVYGGLVGLGFAMTENILYFGRMYTAGGLQGLGYIFVMRAVFSGLLHSIFTGCTGAGLGYAREATSGVQKIAVPIAGYIAGMLLHALWNGTWALIGLANIQVGFLVAVFVITPGMFLLYGVPSIMVLLIVARAGWKRETRAIEEFLKDEVKGGTILESEYALLTNTRERFRHLVRAFSKHGPSGWMALRRLYELEVDLAFRKAQEARGEKLPSFDQVMTVDGFRQRIGQVRQQLTAMGVSTA